MSDEMIAVIFDTETTDKDPQLAKIVQLGVLLDHGADEVPEIIMNALCDPDVPIPAEASEVHGIVEEHLEYAPSDKVNVQHFLNYLGKIAFPVLVGHNIGYYDVPVVKAVHEDIHNYPQIDTYMMARRIYPEAESHKLSDLYVMLGGDMNPEGAHDAIYDCILNHFVFHKMMEKLNYTVEEFWEYSLLPVPFSIMPFGKHKGKRLEDVPTGYLRWCHDNFEDVDIDFKATFDKYLFEKDDATAH